MTSHRDCLAHVDPDGTPTVFDCACRTNPDKLQGIACAGAGCGFCLADVKLPIVPPHIREAYRPPFKHDGMFGGRYLYDAKNNTVGDMTTGTFRVRGWGWLQKRVNGARVHDDFEAYASTLFTETDSSDVVVAKLNAVWGVEG